ncbi:Riboflavin biosynthesis protein RibBA [Anoxybacillus sp. BCO1]|nr:Riboflavin biosynthesis protein RibBA [Anoxybacillus sp. BCO1]
MFHTIEEAIYDLMQGKIIIVCDDEDRENEGDFVALAEKATPEVINFMITHGRGLVCVPITEELADRLDLAPMVNHNTDAHGTAFTVSIDHKATTTGISAFERSLTIQEMLNPEAKASDFKRPGHIFSACCEKRRGIAPRGAYGSSCRFSPSLWSKASRCHL